MTGAIWTVALAAALGQAPYPAPVPEVGGPAPVTATGGQYGHEQLYPYDAYDNWVHGHFQEIPAYGGFHFFRPYNYKHLLSQSQVAGGWGMSPTMPYSQEYFRKFAPATSPLDVPEGSMPIRRQVPAWQPDAPRGLGTDYPSALRPAPLSPVDPASYLPGRNPRAERLQEQIRRQQIELQALEAQLATEAADSETGAATVETLPGPMLAPR